MSPAVANDSDLQSELIHFLAELEARVRPLAVARSLAWWAVATNGTEEAGAAFASATRALNSAWGAVNHDGGLRRWLDSGVGDPIARRMLEVAWREHAARRGDPALQAEIADTEAGVLRAYSTHRPQLDGKPIASTEIEAILRADADTERRRRAWEASQEIGAAVRDELLSLVRLRNRLAKSLGFSDFRQMALANSEIDADRLDVMMGRVDTATRDPFLRVKAEIDQNAAIRFGVPLRELRPWHYPDVHFQRAPAIGGLDLDLIYSDMDLARLATSFFDSIGMNARPVLAKSDLEPRLGKSEHAFCSSIDRSGDVRVLCNLRPSERWAETLLHELGHAMYHRYIDRALPWLLRTPAHALVNEGIAMLMGRQARDADFLSDCVRLGSAKLLGEAASLARHRSAGMLIFVRNALVVTEFERALYADPDRDDLEAVWWNLKERHQGLSCPERRARPDWCSRIHLAVSPAYYHNYVYGELVASQLRARFAARTKRAALVENIGAGEFLIQAIFSRGATARWDQLIEGATGEPLTPTYFLRDYVT